VAGTTDINVIVAQGDTVREVQNIRKQILELGQQSIAQKSEEQKKESRSKVHQFQPGDKIEIRSEEERQAGLKREKKEEKGEPSASDEKEPVSPSGNLIDIKV
jgi:uncharacterized protein related to proFAR isomerase